MIILGARFIPIDARAAGCDLEATDQVRPAILEVFAVGIYLAFIGYFVLTKTSDGIVAQLVVGTAGIAIMTAVAYYRSWSKRVEKSAHGHAGPPSAEKSQVAPGDLARPAERAIIRGVIVRSRDSEKARVGAAHHGDMVTRDFRRDVLSKSSPTSSTTVGRVSPSPVNWGNVGLHNLE